jgi:hypothetical protein
MITITSDYRTDLKTARAAGIKFSKQPSKVALYDAIADFNSLLDLPMSALDVPVSDHAGTDLDMVLQAAATDEGSTWEGTEGLDTLSDEQILDILNSPDDCGNPLPEYVILSNYGIIDTTMDDECADDEHLGTLSHAETPLSQSPAIVMIVIIIAVLEVTTRATSLGLALMVMAWNKLYNWYYKPVASIKYFPDLLEDTLWN